MKQFYIQKLGFVGNCLLWWRKGGCGYTCDIEQAEVFNDNNPVPLHIKKDMGFKIWSKEYIDKHTSLHVDSEKIDFGESV